MFPYHVQIDSLYLHIMKGTLFKGKQISSLSLRLLKHKMYDLRKSIALIRRGSWVLSSPLFCLYLNEQGAGKILIKIGIQKISKFSQPW